MPCVQKKRVFLPGYRRSVTRNWRSAYERCPDLGKEHSGIGINKLREITNEDKCKFVLWVGNKRLIKRRLFDCFIEQAYSI